MIIKEDNDMSVLAYNKYLEEHTERDKKKIVSEFEELGEHFLEEIERKKKRKKLQQLTLIPYILKHSLYDEEELKSYSFEDVQDIYNEIKKKRKPAIIKFIQFIFNIE